MSATPLSSKRRAAPSPNATPRPPTTTNNNNITSAPPTTHKRPVLSPRNKEDAITSATPRKASAPIAMTPGRRAVSASQHASTVRRAQTLRSIGFSTGKLESKRRDKEDVPFPAQGEERTARPERRAIHSQAATQAAAAILTPGATATSSKTPLSRSTRARTPSANLAASTSARTPAKRKSRVSIADLEKEIRSATKASDDGSVSRSARALLPPRPPSTASVASRIAKSTSTSHTSTSSLHSPTEGAPAALSVARRAVKPSPGIGLARPVPTTARKASTPLPRLASTSQPAKPSTDKPAPSVSVISKPLPSAVSTLARPASALKHTSIPRATKKSSDESPTVEQDLVRRTRKLALTAPPLVSALKRPASRSEGQGEFAGGAAIRSRTPSIAVSASSSKMHSRSISTSSRRERPQNDERDEEMEANLSWETVESRRVSALSIQSVDSVPPPKPCGLLATPRTALPSRTDISYVSPDPVARVAQTSRRGKGRESSSLEELLKASLLKLPHLHRGGQDEDDERKGREEWLYEEGVSEVMRREMRNIGTPLRVSRIMEDRRDEYEDEEEDIPPVPVLDLSSLRKAFPKSSSRRSSTASSTSTAPPSLSQSSPTFIATRTNEDQEAHDRELVALQAHLSSLESLLSTRDAELLTLRLSHTSLSSALSSVQGQLHATAHALMLREGEAAELQTLYARGGQGARDAVERGEREGQRWMGEVRSERERVGMELGVVRLLGEGLDAWSRQVCES